MNSMEKSLEPTGFSTRLRNALKSLTGYVDVFMLEDVVKRYAADPARLTADFLRTPGAGRATWAELEVFLKHHAIQEHTVGRITLMSQDDASHHRRTIDEALAHVDSSDPVYSGLRRIQEVLRSSTVMIEQPEDARPEFAENG